MNAYATYHEQRRDLLMHSARYLHRWIADTKAQRIPPHKYAMPGAVDAMNECVAKARMHNHLVLMHRTQRGA